MAIIKIKDATVTRVNRTGYGVQVTEPEKQSNGRTYKGDRYTIWFTQPSGLTEGDKVSISGFLATKVGEPWTDRDGNQRTSVELSVNNPRIDTDGQVQSDAEPVPDSGDWAHTVNDAETPF